VNPLEKTAPAALLRWEPVLVCLLAWAGFVAIPLSIGELGLSWDALNHHFYLGWTAEIPRFDRDFVASGYQSFQYPYLYWPVYRMAASGWTGMWVGAMLATIQVVAVPPVWMLARTCMPGRTNFDLAMRVLAVALAFMTAVVLSIFDSSSNDLMAAIPLTWALAFAMLPLGEGSPGPAAARRWVALSGLCAGIAVAFKLSNGPLAVLIPVLWLFSARGARPRLLNTAWGCLATLAGFLVAYGYWGSLLWQYFGNPVYPFTDDLFVPLRAAAGWKP
jgi:hypothetical protein